MDDCRHRKLVALEARSDDRVRCRHCHLTIRTRDLAGGVCPECLEVTGRRRADFEPVAPAVLPVRYRCEDCGSLMGDDSASSL